MKTAVPIGMVVALIAASACGDPPSGQRLTPESERTGQATQSTDPTTDRMDEPRPEVGINTMPPDSGQRQQPEDDAQRPDQVAPPGFAPEP